MGTTEPSKKRKRKDDDEEPRSSAINDDRFAAAEWDPRFGRVPKVKKKGVVDERFQEALKNNPGFRQSQTATDRFGRPKKVQSLNRTLKEIAKGDDDDSESDSDDEIQVASEPIAQGAHVQYESSDDDDSSAEEMDDEEVEDIPRGKATRRLAVMGLDWSNTRAVDIFASLQSFVPTGKQIANVAVHPSKFGLERLAKEAVMGPLVMSKDDLQVVENAKKNMAAAKEDEKDDDGSDSSDSSDDSASEYSGDDEKESRKWKEQLALRKYEEDRMKYFYAVVEFEDVKSADSVYEQCDGVEYAQSGRAFDLRFIPEDMVIETTPREKADRIPEGYAPPNVAPSTLNNSTVKLSWDADAPDRMILKKKAFGRHKLDEENLKAYLAGSSEDEGKPSADDLDKKRRMLLGGDDNGEEVEDDDMNMEITFEPGMLEKGEEIVKRKLEKEEQKDETAWEARMRRRAERKAEKRRARKDALAEEKEAADSAEDEEDGEGRGFENPAMASDSFFMAGDDGEQTTKAKKSKRDKKNKKPDIDVDEDEEKRKRAELELLVMDDAPKVREGETSMREMLAAVESDDDDDRARRRKEKRTRGKRRSQKARGENGTVAKPSAVDTEDTRFQGLFESHLYALDPTHPKFKDNETTQKILQEKKRRARNRPQDHVASGDTGHVAAKGKPERKEESVSEIAALLKARAKARASKSKAGKSKV